MNQNQFFKNLLLIGTLLLLIISLFTLLEVNPSKEIESTRSTRTLEYFNNPDAVIELAGKIFTRENTEVPEPFTEYWLRLDEPLLVSSGFGNEYVEEILLNASRGLEDGKIESYVDTSVVLAGTLEWGPAETRMIGVLDLYSK